MYFSNNLWGAVKNSLLGILKLQTKTKKCKKICFTGMDCKGGLQDKSIYTILPKKDLLRRKYFAPLQ
jgi:hypothetical protein